MVDVVNEAVECCDPLHQALFHLDPLAVRNDARNQIEGDQPLGARAILVLGAIDGKGDADTAKDHLGLFTALAIVFGMRFGIADHLVDVLLVERRLPGDRHRLLLAGRPILGADVNDAVGVDVEGDFDLRNATRCRR